MCKLMCLHTIIKFIYAGEIPRSSTSELWNKKGVVNMMFNVSTPQVPNSSTVEVKTAILKLYKQNTCVNQLTKEVSL